MSKPIHDSGRKDASIADQLRAARIAAGLTQQAAAEKTGVNRRTIEAWETGRNEPHPLMAQAYLALLSA